MRTKEEIQTDFNQPCNADFPTYNHISPTTNSKMAVQLETLLDMRELLVEIKEELQEIKENIA